MKKHHIFLAASLAFSAIYSGAVYLNPPLAFLLIPLFVAQTAGAFLMGSAVASCVALAAIAGSFWLALDNWISALVSTFILLIGSFVLARQTESGALLKHKILTAGGTIAVLVLFLTVPAVKQTDAAILQEIAASVKESIVRTFTEMYAHSGTLFSADETEALAASLIDASYKLLPCVLLVISAVFGYIALWILHGILKMFGIRIMPPHFSVLKSSPVTVLIAVISFAAILIFKDGVLSIVFTNIYAITTFLLSMSGLSLVDWFLMKRGLKTFIRLFLVLILYMLLSNAVGTVLLCLLSSADAYVNFRRIEG